MGSPASARCQEPPDLARAPQEARSPRTRAGPTGPEKLQRPPSICTESFQPSPWGVRPHPTRRSCAWRGSATPTVSIRAPRWERGEDEEEGGSPFPCPGSQLSAAWRAAGTAPGSGAAAPLALLIFSAAEAWTAPRRPRRRRGDGAREPAGRARGPRAGRGRSWAGPRQPPGRALRSAAPPTAAAPATPARTRSCMGSALFPFAPRLLRRPPFTPRLSQALLLQRPARSEPGALEVPAGGVVSPSPPRPPLYAVDAPPVLSPQGLGPGLGLPFSSPQQRQALWGREGAPRSPRQVREGCVDSFSRGEHVAPRSGPFCSLYFILKLYLMLLYERGRGGESCPGHPYVQMSYLLCVYQR